MEKMLQQIGEMGVIPVIKIDRVEDAVPLAKALVEGGMPCAEVTFRTAAAADAIKAMSEAYPEMLVGAGTVLTTEQADTAIKCGAKFIVSPGLNPETVKHCIKNGYPILPGVATPTEVEAGLALGLTHLKFFPAEAAGGVKMIKAMAAPYTSVKFMPTGGINVGNIKEYLTCKAVFACGGSWMVPGDMITNGEFDKIKALVEEAVALLKEIRK